MKITRVLGAATTASVASVFLLLAASDAAVADHTHVKVVGNDGCVVTALGAREEDVDLPGAMFAHYPHGAPIPQTDERTHPLHVLVHQGVDGENMPPYVLGSDDEKTACAGESVNR